MKMRLLIGVFSAALISSSIAAQSNKSTQNRAGTREAQKIDVEYTQTIEQNLQDPRITTELVGHLPTSDTVKLVSW